MDSFRGFVQVAPRNGLGRVAVVGAGPAGLSCAGELAKTGHDVTIFEKRALPGGLSTYGIVSLREPINISVAEAESIERMGVSIQLQVTADVDALLDQFDAIFIAIGQGKTPTLDMIGEHLVTDGIEFIERSKLDPNSLYVGRHVTIIGAGNTAMDCALIAKNLGAETVTIIYRRYEEDIRAYPHEVETVRRMGTQFQFGTHPLEVISNGDEVIGLRCIAVSSRLKVEQESGTLEGSYVVPTDHVIKAIGQVKHPVGVLQENGFIVVDKEMRTSHPRIFAGGDCVRSKGSASTVMAVQDGKIAAKAIRNYLEAQLG